MQLEAETLGFQRAFPEVGPANVKGIEINPYAAELTRVSVWIGEIQWMRRTGFSEARDPILKPLDTIECRDAILTPDGIEPDWPDADVVIGNPPFFWGIRRSAGLLARTTSTRCAVSTRVRFPPSLIDLVCYWFYKAGKLVANSASSRSSRGPATGATAERVAVARYL